MAKKAKKRGVKPGTKRGPYRKAKAKPIQKMGFMELDYDPEPIVGNNIPSLISDLTSTIDTLEAQLTAQIDRIKSILV